ncbi:UNVERIFIED_ORG: hypothetical protein J2Y78_004527 [Buttiauxella agrestis ATCC 33320]
MFGDGSDRSNRIEFPSVIDYYAQLFSRFLHLNMPGWAMDCSPFTLCSPPNLLMRYGENNYLSVEI